MREETDFRWKKNLCIVCAAELVAIPGFSTSFPFMPLFVQELGVTGLKQVEIWSGLLTTGSATALGNAVGPIVGAAIAATLGMRSVFLWVAAIFALIGI